MGKKFKCSSEAQKRAIAASYARKKAAEQGKRETTQKKAEFPEDFPFWARLKISKNRTTLVIDEKQAHNKKSNKVEDSFVHRETTHTKGHGERIEPNPMKGDSRPMYLRSPRVLPKRLFKPHNLDLDMPDDLKQRYGKKRLTPDEEKE